MKTQSIFLSDISSASDLWYSRLCSVRCHFDGVSLTLSIFYSHFLDIMCWTYVQLQVVYILPCKTRTEMYSKINKAGCLICSSDILWAVVRLAGSLIKQLFCRFFFLMFFLNPNLFFSIRGLSASSCSFYPHVSLLSPAPFWRFMSAPEPSDCLKIVCVV